MTEERSYTALFPFCGIGGGALGFRDAEVSLLSTRARFDVLGGIDMDPGACKDFERLTGAPSLCRDVSTITPAELRAFAGLRAPDVVFLSPPCKGASGLLSASKARSAKYQRMNRLALAWMQLMLATWPEPPRLVLLENVPRLQQRAATMLRRLRSLLRAAGYVFSDGFHDCGELGGLAQVRRRYLLVARHARRCPPLLYQPPRRRVRGCGEVLGELPVPLSPEAAAWGRLHELPRLSWLNWVRLALIPAGGDWRDLDGVLSDGQPRREVFRRHHVQRWTEPSDTVAGSGSNGPSAIADPRGASLGAHWNKMRVEDWQQPAHTVTGALQVGSGAPSVADPRVRVAYDHGYGVLRFDEPSSTIAGGSHPGQGAYSVADPRIGELHGSSAQSYIEIEKVLGARPKDGSVLVLDRCEGQSRLRSRGQASERQARGDESASLCMGATRGANSCGDPARAARMRQPELRASRSGSPASRDARAEHGRDGIAEESRSRVAQAKHEAERPGRSSDPRFDGTWGSPCTEIRCLTANDLRHPKGTHTDSRYRLMTWRQALASLDEYDPRKPPPFTPVIVAADGTWHRPLTTLELAVLQGFPARVDGVPLAFHGSSVSAWRERIGNAVPPPAARAIAERMLVALVEGDLEAFSLAGGLDVWVQPAEVTAP